MAVYTFGTLLSILLAGISINFYQKRKYYKRLRLAYPVLASKVFAVLSFIPLAFISAVRYGVGTDYFSYAFSYRTHATFHAEQGEVLHTLLLQGLNKLSQDPQIFFAVTSVIICASYYIAIYKHSQSPMFSIALFVLTREYFRSMNGIRQYEAMAVLLFSLPALEKKDWKKALCLIVIASFFHSSAIVFGGILVLSMVQFRPATLVGISAAAFIFLGTFQTVLYQIVDRFTRFGHYFFSETYSESVVMRSYFFLYGAMLLLLLYLSYLQKMKSSRQIDMLLNVAFFGLICSVLGMALPRILTRVVWYADALIVIYLPSAVRAIEDKALRLFVQWGVIICYLILCLYNIVLQGNQDVLPYMTFWQ